VIGIAHIKKIIPHRYPVLLLDRVTEVEPGRALVAHKAITGREPCYEHLGDDAPPGRYAYPAGQLMESWAQAAVLLARWQSPNPDVRTGQVELLSGIRNVTMVASVYPGDVVEHRVELIRAVEDAAVLTGSSLVNGRLVLRVGSFTMARRGIEALTGGQGGEG
jgi:3-hydroxyacyl-[acyl-carrier-protein] dehydratase